MEGLKLRMDNLFEGVKVLGEFKMISFLTLYGVVLFELITQTILHLENNSTHDFRL
jgi:hypothetical protein